MQLSNPKANTLKVSISVLLLCVYLFGSFVANILHPLYHCHHNHFSNLAVISTDISSHTTHFQYLDSSNDDKDETLIEFCVLCHFGIFTESIVEQESDKTFIQITDFQFKNYYYNNYHSQFFAQISSRAPPFSIS